jgi:23S rRNA (cytidine1920-2'-O)/16S rRNA (cytidine1409-2'-O)-methyltransferase
MVQRTRLDAELVRRTLVDSRHEAQELIQAGRVLVNGAIAAKSAHLVAPFDALIVTGPPRRFVSRGGDKLLAAIETFDLVIEGCSALDAGASTGGFTDCLLQHGAHSVIAVDVGHGQLHPRIRNDERVRVIERFNIRRLTREDLGGPVDLAVADLSFISLTAVIPALTSVLEVGGHMILLVKPQFEVGRQEVSRGRGVVTDPELHRAACDAVGEGCERAGVDVLDVIPSPLLGQEGNREFLLLGVVRERIPQ